ncbi:MAG: c-type cytochrome [Acidimicrobiales bacterium]
MTERRSRRLLVAVVASLALGSAACGGDADAQVQRGEALARDLGCMACHSTGTADGLGPGWGGIWDTERELVDGSTVVVDEEYLRRSVVDPSADIVAGYRQMMPTIAMSDAELDDIVAYLREVSGG